MAVKARRIVKGVGRLQYSVSSRDLLDTEHPLHNTFVKWCGQPTKRQAAKFLQKFPQYRQLTS